jgi:hypothetical protein
MWLMRTAWAMMAVMTVRTPASRSRVSGSTKGLAAALTRAGAIEVLWVRADVGDHPPLAGGEYSAGNALADGVNAAALLLGGETVGGLDAESPGHVVMDDQAAQLDAHVGGEHPHHPVEDLIEFEGTAHNRGSLTENVEATFHGARPFIRYYDDSLDALLGYIIDPPGGIQELCLVPGKNGADYGAALEGDADFAVRLRRAF